MRRRAFLAAVAGLVAGKGLAAAAPVAAALPALPAVLSLEEMQFVNGRCISAEDLERLRLAVLEMAAALSAPKTVRFGVGR